MRNKIEMSALAVSRASKSGYYYVGGVSCLILQVVPTGSKTWLLRAVVGNRRREIGLGSYPSVTLSQARELARELRSQIKQGIDPVLVRQEAKLALKQSQLKCFTFEQASKAFINITKASWKNNKHADQWHYSLEQFAFPIMGAMNVSEIDTSHVLAALKPIWTSKTVTASRLRGRIESVLDWSRVAGYRFGENPARWKGHLSHLLPAPSKVKKARHHPALPFAEMSCFMAMLRNIDGASSKALQFAILTVARSSEVRFATWDEVNLGSALWCIPQERMKAEREHRVPLSEPALELLRQTPESMRSGLLFPTQKFVALSDMAMTSMLRRMHKSKIEAGSASGWVDGASQLVTAHGFRSTFRDWAGETTSHSREVIEHALAHQLRDKAEAAYARGTLLAKRSALMGEWGAFCQVKI